MNDLRLATYSLIYFVISGYTSNGWTGITVTDSFPKDPSKIDSLPTVCVSHDITSLEPFQLGPGKSNRRRFSVYVYAQEDGVRDDLSQDIADHLFSNQCDIKNYNEGFPAPFGVAGEPSIVGRMDFENIRMISNSMTDKPQTAVRHLMQITCDGIIYSDT